MDGESSPVGNGSERLIGQVWAEREKDSGPVGLFAGIPLLPASLENLQAGCWRSATSLAGP